MKKSVRVLLTGLSSFTVGFYLGGKFLAGMVNDNKMRADRNQANMMVLDDWLDYLYSGGRMEDFFIKNAYRKIMIYGNGYIGVRLSQALEKTDIEVVAVMDKAAGNDGDGQVIGTDADIPEVDCIVVTPVFYYDDICAMLSERTDIPIVSIKDILDKEILE